MYTFPEQPSRDAPLLRRHIPARPIPTPRARLKQGTLAALGIFVAGMAFGVWAMAPVKAGPGTVVLTPHRAVYDMKLNPTKNGLGSGGGSGRMVYEIRGGACVGYSISMRWVAERSRNGAGTSIEDLRYASWEAGDGTDFTYSSTRYQDRRLDDVLEASATKGTAEADGVIRLSKPQKVKVPLPADVIFPTEHMKLVIADAVAGKTVRTDRIYDVSDDGKAVYDTFTLITPMTDADRVAGLQGRPKLEGLQSWSANISYFLSDPSGSGEGVPAYEQTFALFSNGVSTKMRLGTSNVMIDAVLSEVEFLPPTDC